MQNHAPLCVIAGGERILGISGLLAREIGKVSLAGRVARSDSAFVNVTPDDIEKQNLRLKRDINKTFKLASEFCMVDCLCRARTR